VSLTAVAVITVPALTGTGEMTDERLASDLVDAQSAIDEVARMATNLQGSVAKFRY
jgi:hypothetical protein